jgi:hypothetical protein
MEIYGRESAVSGNHHMIRPRISLDVKGAVAALRADMTGMRRASIRALNTTIIDVREAERAAMQSVFDRPTPYTLNAFHPWYATDSNPRAELRQRMFGGGQPREWLVPQSDGGQRHAKAFERAIAARMGLAPGAVQIMPGPGARLDRYGNISGGQLTQILSDLGAQRDTTRNATVNSRKRNKRARHIIIKGKGGKAGVIAVRKAGGLVVVATITTKAAIYTTRFAFEQVARTTVEQRFAPNFAAAMARYGLR